MKVLELGRCYFMMSYADEQLRMPLVETYIFIGLNILSPDSGSSDKVWYFKHPDSFLTSGYDVDQSHLADCIRVGEDTIELILNMSELIEQLSDVVAPRGV